MNRGRKTEKGTAKVGLILLRGLSVTQLNPLLFDMNILTHVHVPETTPLANPFPNEEKFIHSQKFRFWTIRTSNRFVEEIPSF